jgi:hypothetical protein
MRQVLALANRIGCNNVLMESDSSETVDACSDNEAWWGNPRLSLQIALILQLLSEGSASCNVKLMKLLMN